MLDLKAGTKRVRRGKQHMGIASSVNVRGRIHLLLVIYLPDAASHRPTSRSALRNMHGRLLRCVLLCTASRGQSQKHPAKSLLAAGRKTQKLNRHSQNGEAQVKSNGQEVRPSHPSHASLMPEAGGYGGLDSPVARRSLQSCDVPSCRRCGI